MPNKGFARRPQESVCSDGPEAREVSRPRAGSARESLVGRDASASGGGRAESSWSTLRGARVAVPDV